MRSRFYQRFYEENKVTPIKSIRRTLKDKKKDQDEKLSEYRKMRRKFEAKGTADDKKDFNALSERMVQVGLDKFRADLEDLEDGQKDATQQMEERLEKLSEVQRRAVSRAIAGKRTSSRLSEKPRRTLSSSKSSEARRSSRDAHRTVPSSRKSSETRRSSRDAHRTVPSSRKL